MRGTIAFAFALGLGCSGGSKTSPDTYYSDLASSYCDMLLRCGLTPDHATCMATENAGPIAFSFVGDQEILAAMLASGKASFDGAEADSCVASFESVACDITSLNFAEGAQVNCELPVDGHLAAGSACMQPGECQSGYCDLSGAECTSACCAGTCAPVMPLAGEGSACVVASCEPGTYCDGKICFVPGAAGAPCTETIDCGPTLNCGSNGTCVHPPALGQPCAIGGDAQCGALGAVCNTAGICVAGGLPGDSCADHPCEYAYLCGSAGVCEDEPGAGSACAPNQVCAPGAYCDGSACQPLLPNGSPAACSDDCESGVTTEGSDGGAICVPFQVCS